MANQEAVQMSLPLPPAHYVNLYTDENIRKNRAPKPPPPIMDGTTYTMFGNPYNNEETIIRPLESQGFKRLYPQHFDRKKELKKLNHSLLANFLDLIDLLVNYPDSPRRTEKIEDLSLLFVHIHHLLNEFRPHQARETLRVMMEMQKRQRIETAQRFQKHLDRVRDMIQDAFANLAEKESPTEAGSSMDVDQDIKAEKDAKGSPHCDPLDRLMCNLVDSM